MSGDARTWTRARSTWPILLASLGALPLCACAPRGGAREVYARMHLAACAGDANAFLANVEEEAILDNVMHRQNHPLSRAAVRSLVGTVLDQWRKDIAEAGPQSSICAWQYVAMVVQGERQRIEVQAGSGSRKYLYFAPVRNAMMMVDFESPGTSEGAIR